ncbi:MAG TPA: hypothetical protein ENN19_16410 [Chloroflexi bacterium]|nr:hypothetical protein [Chloroflexota bacterium]
MKRLKFLVAALLVWLFCFYNIERLSAPIDLTDVAYTFVPLVAVAFIFIPHLRKIPFGVSLAGSVLIFLVLKAGVKSSIWGASLPLTLMEICFVGVTGLLACQVNERIQEFEQVVDRISIGKFWKPGTFSSDQAEMYQELRRARHYQRPLSLISVGVDEASMQVALDRMVQEAQQAMMKQYVLSDVARILSEQLEDYNIIAQKDGGYLVLLPEVGGESLAELTDRLREIVERQVGADLQIGTASFPQDAVTFEGLVRKACDGINRRGMVEREIVFERSLEREREIN